MKVGDIVVGKTMGYSVKVDTIVDEVYFNGIIVDTNNISGMKIGEKGYYFEKNGFNIKQNIGGIKMSKVFELKKMEMADGKNLVVELVLLNKNLLESIMEENEIKEFRVSSSGIGINLVDILNGKDLTKVIPKDKVHLLELVLDTFELEYLGDGEEDDFYTLSIDEKLNTIYELLKG